MTIQEKYDYVLKEASLHKNKILSPEDFNISNDDLYAILEKIKKNNHMKITIYIDDSFSAEITYEGIEYLENGFNKKNKQDDLGAKNTIFNIKNAGIVSTGASSTNTYISKPKQKSILGKLLDWFSKVFNFIKLLLS